MKVLILITQVLLITFSSLYSLGMNEEYEKIDGAFILQYRTSPNGINRFKATVSQHITNSYIREDSYVNFTWLKKDSYNKNKTNYSVFPILDFAMHYLVYNNSDQWEFDPGTLLSPYFLLNSSHYILTKKMTHKFPELILAFFIKNNTDLFVIEKNNWAQLSPGLGVRLFLGGQYGVVIESGYEFKAKYLFKEEKFHNDSDLFFSLGLLLGSV